VINSLPPAVVIGAELNGLGVCRSLGKGGGIVSYVIDRKWRNPAMWSRYAKSVRMGMLHGPEIIHDLLTLQAKLGQQPVLIITDELCLLTVSKFRSKLDGLFRFRLPPHETVVMLHDKALFHEFAVANNLPVPKSEVLRSAADIHHIRSLSLPLIIKPADKRHFHLSGAPRLVVAADWETAERATRKLVEVFGEIIVQECVDGPDNSIYFCLFYRKDSSTVIFSGQKLASSPPRTGSTAFCVRADTGIGNVLEKITHDFLDMVDYVGFGGIEYKWDSVTRRFVIIEPTVGRTDWQEEIAMLSGVNIPLAGYCYECDLPIPDSEQIADIVWQASFIERMKLGSNAPSLVGTSVVDGFWRRDDPLPALIHYPFEMVLSLPAIVTGWMERTFKHETGSVIFEPEPPLIKEQKKNVLE
jgi:D-aspartate ligase